MKISGTTHLETNLYAITKRQGDKPALVTGTISELSHDTVEISPSARKLAASDVVNHAAKYFGTAQINDSLNRVLEDQPPEVREAVYGLIQSNMITDGNVTGEEERAALLEMGLTQAKYIADNYLSGDKAAEFLSTIEQIGAIAKTRTVDPETGEIHYTTPSQRPAGAPDDYIKTTDLMKQFEPETLNKLNEAIASGQDWADILLTFAKKAANRQEWLKEYKAEADKLMEGIQQTVSNNRFQTASTANLALFAKDMQDLIANSGFADTDILSDNLAAFVRTLGDRKG